MHAATPASADKLVDVHIHQLKDQRKAASGLLVQNLDQLDDAWVWGEAPQRLDLAQVVDLLLALELALHALDGRHLPILDALRLEHLREGALAFLGDEAVLVHTCAFQASAPAAADPLRLDRTNCQRAKAVVNLVIGEGIRFTVPGGDLGECEPKKSSRQTKPALVPAEEMPPPPHLGQNVVAALPP